MSISLVGRQWQRYQSPYLLHPGETYPKNQRVRRSKTWAFTRYDLNLKFVKRFRRTSNFVLNLNLTLFRQFIPQNFQLRFWRYITGSTSWHLHIWHHVLVKRPNVARMSCCHVLRVPTRVLRSSSHKCFWVPGHEIWQQSTDAFFVPLHSFGHTVFTSRDILASHSTFAG